ncbi:MAG: hypothetical protein HKO57_11980, partial [Akkermansiaceae bacterium]|nr:hypothetical protein [Akkermansiaceae bacterium]
MAALPAIEAAYWPGVNGSSPAASSVTNAKAAFASWNIVTGGGAIKGDPVDRDNTGGINSFLGVLARAWHHDGDSEARDMALDTVRHLLDQGFAGGSAEAAAADFNGYATREIVRALLLLRNDFPPAERAAVKDLLRWRLKRGFWWDPNLGRNKNTDHLHTESSGLMGLALGFSDTAQEQVEELRGLRHYFEGFLEFSPGTSDGIKPDGTGFHHWTHYNHYMYAYGQLADRLFVLHGTPFQIAPASYERFRDACYVLSLFGNDVEFANALSGRFPMTGTFPMSCGAVSKLATVGGAFTGQAADPKLARMHNRIWGNEPAFASFGTEPEPRGFWQFNYSPGALYRDGDAVIKVKGLTDTFWGSEIYSNANRYGRYQSYGAVEVFYPGGRSASGFGLDGWDWNSPPGATTIKLPFPDLEAQSSRQDELAATRHCGALSCDLDPDGDFGVKGRFGIFGMKFQQAPISGSHDASFTFRKSVFCFDGRVLCLGSDIANDDSANETVTTLFQGALPGTSTPTNHLGTNLTAFPLNSTWTGGSRWFLDHLGTGYYLPGDHIVELARQNQASPPQSGSGPDTSGDFAKAWISHGKAPAGEGYEYLVIPGTNAGALQQLEADMNGPQPPYSVLQKSSEGHIVHLAGENAHAYVMFEASPAVGHGPVTGTTAPALVATRRTANYMLLSYANPELDLEFRVEEEAGLVTADVRLGEEWAIDSGDPRASSIPQGDGSTLLRFGTRHGLPVELGLIHFIDFAAWQQEQFTAAELADPLVSGASADPDGDGLANMLEYGLRLDP